MKLLHPFMPFISEEIWQDISIRSIDNALIISNYPKKSSYDNQVTGNFKKAQEVISKIRVIRKDKQIPFKEQIKLYEMDYNGTTHEFDPVIAKLGNLSELKMVDEKIEGSISFRVGPTEYFIPIESEHDNEAEKEKLLEELAYAEGFLKGVRKKLSNDRFVNNAPENVVAIERKKEADTLAKIQTIKASLKNL
jgi:valyl-tRNA synthetase